MSLLGKVFALLMLFCFLNVEVSAETALGLRVRKSLENAGTNSNEFFQQMGNEYGTAETNPDLLGMLLARPSKRLWCRKGMTYNHVLGSCTPSFTALRGKGRRQQM